MRKIIATALMVILVVSSFAGCGNTSSKNQAKGTEMEYEGKLMDDSYVHEVNIEISDTDWKDLLKNPLDKTKYKVNITIDGEEFSDVSFATKGNTSLSQIASDNSTNRYSFKINFDKYVEGQNYYGLDKLNLNNLMSDATYMKDYLSYEIMREAGTAAPLASFVNINVNGEAWGLYLAVEDVSDSFITRNYGEGEGELYKPETQQLNNMGKGKEGMPPQTSGGAIGERPEMSQGQMPTGAAMQVSPDGKEAGFKGFGGSSNGAGLAYTDDKLESYSDIFDNAETNVTDEDKTRVIQALKQLSKGEELDKCLDVDSVIRYFVAHNFVDNYDSYTGNMLHNYYLYENSGLLSVIPWDYNLAFGAFGGMRKPGEHNAENVEKTTDKQITDKKTTDNATAMVNYAIDTPLSGANEADRPLWSAIINNEEYKELYHKYFDELITNYFESGKFDEKVTSVYEMIRPYVEKDATAFYTVEEFDKAYSTLKEFCKLRTESIRKQLDGKIPNTTEGQQEDGVELVDASKIKTDDMGTQKGGEPKQKNN